MGYNPAMSFIAKFFLLVTVVGFAELYLLIQVAAQLTFPGTLAVCVFTGVAGGALVRHQGLRTLAQVQRSLASGELPARQIVSGVVLLMVGATLILPGFVSDTVGFLLLVPPIRSWTAQRLISYFKGKLSVSSWANPMKMNMGWAPGAEPDRGDVIDIDPDPDPERDTASPPHRARVIDIAPEPDPDSDSELDSDSRPPDLHPG